MQDFGSFNKIKIPMKKIKDNISSYSTILGFIAIFLLWFVFGSPYFIKGYVPYPSKYQVNFFHPWSDYPSYWGPYKNGAMPDIIDQIYPWKHFTIETYKKGQIPLWNPNSFSGTPHLANNQSAVLSLFNLLFFVFPFVDAWSILVLLQPLLAGIFMYLLLREFKVSVIGALMSAVSFMFCGFIVVWMAYGTLAMVITFLPLTLYAIEKSFKRFSLIPLLILTASIPISIFSGHFQISFYFILYSLAYLVYKYFVTKNLKRALIVLLFYMCGLGIALLQIIPSFQLYANAARSQIFSNKGAIPFQYLITIFAPDFFGNPVTRNDWFGFYAEWAGFIGILPFIFAIFSLFQKKERKNIFFFFIAGFISLLFAMSTPLNIILPLLKIPILSTSIPSRIIVLFSFSFAVLSGFGIDTTREIIEKKQVKKMIITLLGIGGMIFGIWAILVLFKPFPKDKLLIAMKNLFLPTLFYLFALIGLLVSLKIKKKAFTASILLFLVLVAMFDNYRFATKWMPFDPKNLVFPDVPVINAMKKNIGNGRVYGNLGAFVDTYYDIPSIEGYDPLYIRRYGEFIYAAEKGEYNGTEKSVVSLSRRAKYTDKVLDLLGVNLIYNPIGDTHQSWAYPVWDKGDRYSAIYQDDKFQLYRNNMALFRVTLFYRYEVVPDSKQLLKRFYANNFDFRNTLLLEKNPGIPLFSNGAKQTAGTAKITSYTPNMITIETNTNSPALLFLSDTYYPAWKVKVNGKEEKIYRADYAFRAVKVPTGQSLVEFFYSGIL